MLGACRTYEKSTARQGKRPKMSGFLVTWSPLCASESSRFGLVSPPARYDPPKSDRLLVSEHNAALVPWDDSDGMLFYGTGH